MQLKKRHMGPISRALSLLTANLLMANAAEAQVGAAINASGSARNYADGAVNGTDSSNDTSGQLNTVVVDSAVLFYQEKGGRVQAVEPTGSVVYTNSYGDAYSVKVTSDSLTGATPNGATPSSHPQTFTTPARGAGSTVTVTSASGGSTLVNLPGGLQVRQYTIAPNTLPVDNGFRDNRYALDLGYTRQLDSVSKWSIGGAYSQERDYTSFSVNTGYSRDVNHKNTTLSLSANFEYDRSRPFFGSPTPFAVMDGTQKGPNQTKTVISVVAGVTQVMNRRWLAQLNISAGQNSGYQNDPYRIISVVDPTFGAPLQYLYESRPRSRFRESIYWGNKVALGPTVADVSARAYHDSWGITSFTGEISERVPLVAGFYIEPSARYYHQSAANFFQYYLVSGTPLPSFASSDSRLSKFSATTFGVKAGLKILTDGELYVLGETYKQTGAAGPPNAIGDLANQNLFSGVKATSIVAGIRYTFR